MQEQLAKLERRNTQTKANAALPRGRFRGAADGGQFVRQTASTDRGIVVLWAQRIYEDHWRVTVLRPR